MANKIFNNEKEAVKWLADKNFFSVLDKKMNEIMKDKMTSFHISEDFTKNYVRAFEIDYIAIYGAHPLNDSQNKYKYNGIEVKYFYDTSLSRSLPHQAIHLHAP